jgi:hypothetical protein
VKVFKIVSVYFFTVLIFTGSVGVSQFAHFCKKEGAEYSYLIPPSHTCKPEKKAIPCCHSVCGKNKESNNSINEKCCVEQVKMFKITSDFSKNEINTKFSFPTFDFVKLAVFEEVYFQNNARLVRLESRPPPKSGREIIILNQVFRI